MLDMVDEYSKAQIFSDERALLGKAEVTGKIGDKKISLNVHDDVMSQLSTSFIITLSSDAHGLITYKANMLEFRRVASCANTYEVLCELLEVLEIIQRRENFKIKTLIPITLSVGGAGAYPAEIKDISASGVFIETNANLNVGQIIEFMFEKAGPPFLLTAEVVRSKLYGSGLGGFGCKFVDLPVTNESSIRRYVFKLQLAKVKGK